MNKWGKVTTDEINAVLQKQVETNKFAQLRHSFVFAHHILSSTSSGFAELDKRIKSEHNEPIIDGYEYYDFEERLIATLILTHYTIEFAIIDDVSVCHTETFNLDVE